MPPGVSYHNYFYLLSILKQDISSDVLAAIFAVFVLLFLSAIVSGSEIAFFSFGAPEEDVLKNSDKPKDAKILSILERKRLLLSTILISNNFINVGIIILSNYIISNVFNFGNHNFLEVLINVVIVTAFLVFFGEVMPKILASRKNFEFARFTLPFIQFFKMIFYPFALVLAKFGNFLDSKIERKREAINLDEIEKAIDLGVDDNTQERDKSLLKGIVHFGNTTVKQIMKPRVDIIAISAEESFENVLELIKESGYSRIPIFEENIDNIIGILYIKDLLEFLGSNKSFRWQSTLREPSFTSESKKIDDLLREIQISKQHMYIVADEYGGTLGLLSLEDILEEVVGEINDEFDDDEEDVRRNKDGSFLFDGKTSIIDVCKTIGVESSRFEEEKGGSDTLAGLILENLGSMPEENDTIFIDEFEFKVLEIEKNRIKKIYLKINEIEEE